eukprot:8842198-Pyramimonas_sp.AAC.2
MRCAVPSTTSVAPSPGSFVHLGSMGAPRRWSSASASRQPFTRRPRTIPLITSLPMRSAIFATSSISPRTAKVVLIVGLGGGVVALTPLRLPFA